MNSLKNIPEIIQDADMQLLIKAINEMGIKKELSVVVEPAPVPAVSPTPAPATIQARARMRP